jgi:thiamine-monophosphate kinase
MDTMVAGVHFLPDDPADLVARKLLRVNLSDLAASGATPLTYFLSLSLPASVTGDWIADFASGLATDQRIFGIALSGGDTTSTPGPVTLSLTAIGEVPAGQAIRRASATPGEDIYVSGTIGDAALALVLMRKDGVEAALARAPALVARYRLPEPRVALGPALRGIATAAIDISDGLFADLGHICETSGIGAEVSFSAVPLSEAAARQLAGDPQLSEQIVTGGDDYELLFCARPEDAPRIAELARSLGLPITPIGRTTTGTAPLVKAASGEAMSLKSPGWRHF